MAARGTLRNITFTPDASPIQRLPDLSRALWFFVVVDGAPSQVLTSSSLTDTFFLPADTRFGLGSLDQLVMSREQCGSAFNGPLFIAATAGNVVTITYLEMDIETYGEITNLR